MWARAEAMGFDHAWTYDHIAWRTLRDGPWFAAVPTLTAAAMATSTIRLGTMVASPNFRHPVAFARELITLDDVSDGRLTAGLGAGGEGWDATILGQAPWSASERADHFDEFVRLLDLVLRGPTTTFTGQHFSADAAPNQPGCVQQPRVPFAIAATGPRGMRLAVEHADVWVTNGSRSHAGPPLPAPEGAALVRAQMQRLDDHCAAAGRDPATLDRLVVTGIAPGRRPRFGGRLASDPRGVRGDRRHRPRGALAPTDRTVRGRSRHPRAPRRLSRLRGTAVDRDGVGATR